MARWSRELLGRAFGHAASTVRARPMTVVAAFAAVVTFGSLVCVACANDSAIPPDGPTPNDACTSYVAALCAKYDACTAGVYTQVKFGGQSACQAREMLKCIGTLSAPENTASAQGFVNCGQAIAGQSCADFFDQTNAPSACTARPGVRANNLPCVDNGQCQSAWCYAPSTAACGFCADRPPVGAPCNTNTDCGENALLCADDNTCEPPAAPGAACGPHSPCPFAYDCVGTDGGTCVLQGEEAGAPCDVKLRTAPSCESEFGLYCASAGGDAGNHCEPTLLVQAQANCGDVTSTGGIPDAGAPHVFATCASGSACEPPGARTATCAAPAADGMHCDIAVGPPCSKPASCVGMADGSTSGTCVILETNPACN